MIRNAQIEDLPSVHDLVVEFATSFKINRDKLAAQFKETLALSDATILVYELDEKIVGYLLGFQHPSFHANGPLSWVEEIVVAETYRSKGLGSKLMNEFERQTKADGCTYIALATRRAGGFYQKNDYEDSAVYYRKILNSGDKA